jgi:hypothetical protein
MTIKTIEGTEITTETIEIKGMGRSNVPKTTNKKIKFQCVSNSNSKETNPGELIHTGIDGVVDKTKLNIFEDGSDEEYLKFIKEFQNYIDAYKIWNDGHAAYIAYKNFRRCLAGAARDL